ncbi:uncharacterized protein YgbK (DUF1537 family) [Tamaricihabitans halophyticus]|uniref:Uncharacterized protein YgbK (DUF1537 family) n=1 Tax=Tamaricihabitans halophyticus TaxID=1262583 RepID=A0A4R2PSW2_9PSEU|nr:four-carbon acid sugar kinase family protein [Tamaricihabitans halophyticus]TCP39052.1 uncharacterized protein YgbK (DUF1537 family) [Tamaricihabitans halophyticus]
MSHRIRPDKVVVLDDDPTGTQSAHDVDMLLDKPREGLAAFAADDRKAIYVLTNTRAKTPTETSEHIAALAGMITELVGPDTLVVLRGDSTLRGHIALEMTLLGLAQGVGIVVPAFPAGGRTTRQGVHFVRTPDGELPAAATEYARDSVFGYSHSRLVDWAREVGLNGPNSTIELTELRAGGLATIRDALLAAPPGSVLLPDAETDDDIGLIAQGIEAARETGQRVVVRSAAPLAATLAGTSACVVPPRAARSVLVACGSHTDGASRQLERLSTPARLLPSAELLLDPAHDATAELDELAASVRTDLDTRGLAVVATPRQRSLTHGDLEQGAVIMEALVRVVRASAPSADTVVTKGGITGAEIATRALGATVASVQGQVVTGVPIWQLHRADTAGHQQVVVPGNVGGESVLADIIELLRRPA